MKVLAISGSPRTGGNTEIALKMALEVLRAEGIETDFISMAGENPKPCTACMGCRSLDRIGCVQDDTFFDDVFQRVLAADGILVGSPVYFGSATPQIMAVLDRVGYVARSKGENLLRRKVGASIVVARRAGQNFTFAQLNYFFLISEMIVPGSTYWNIAFGLQKGEVADDEEGTKTIKTLAANMAWLLKKIKAE